MTTTALIEELTRLGVTLTPEGDRLRYRGPADAITLELKQRIVEHKVEIIATLTQRENYGPGRPSPENALRPIADRCNEALELLGELTHVFNIRLEVLEATGMSRDNAIKAAKCDTQATETYRRWLALG